MVSERVQQVCGMQKQNVPYSDGKQVDEFSGYQSDECRNSAYLPGRGVAMITKVALLGRGLSIALRFG